MGPQPRQFRGQHCQGTVRAAAFDTNRADVGVMTMTLPELLPSIGYAALPRFHPAIWPLTSHSDDEGRLCIGDVPLTEIADEFRTPTYVIDEADFRSRARRYRKALRHAEVVYAGRPLRPLPW